MNDDIRRQPRERSIFICPQCGARVTERKGCRHYRRVTKEKRSKTSSLPGGAGAAPGTTRGADGVRRYTAEEVRQAIWNEIMKEFTDISVSDRTERAYEVTGLVMAALENYDH